MMRYHALIAASTIAWATSASAQQNTNCQPDGIGGVSCTTTGQPGSGGINWGLLGPPANVGESFQNGFDQARLAREQADDRRRAEQQQFVADQQAAAVAAQSAAERDFSAQSLQQAQAQTMEAARMLNAKDCPGAISYALSVGNMPLANQVKAFCAK